MQGGKSYDTTHTFAPSQETDVTTDNNFPFHVSANKLSLVYVVMRNKRKKKKYNVVSDVDPLIINII